MKQKINLAKKPIVLVIIDGLGFDDNRDANAWKLASSPVLDHLLKEYPNLRLGASGTDVGLPAGQIGNSEVGHLNIGAGQVVYTGLTLIQKAIEDHSFYNNEAFLKVIEHVKKNKSTLHLMGLLSKGGVHSLENHAYEILKLASKNKISELSIHVFGDGRDVPPKVLDKAVIRLEKELKKYSAKYKIVSVQGRIYAMDRDKIFTKTEEAFEALKGNCKNVFSSPLEYVHSSYKQGITDEFIKPGITSDREAKFLKDNDGVIFFNFRPDRARQLSHFLVGSNLYTILPKKPLRNIFLVSMMKYEGINKALPAFDSMEIPDTLGSTISSWGLKQLRIAETQKYAHVTFFMDGGKEVKLPGAQRILIPSLKIENFADAPEMSAKKITQKLLSVIEDFDLVILNFANTDMVGHTGDLAAAIKAVEVVDQEIGKIKKKVDSLQGTMFITADHGNAEIMKDKNGNPVTKHTTSKVPFIVTDKALKLKKTGVLANITPTILEYMKIPIPKSMSAKSLIEKK